MLSAQEMKQICRNCLIVCRISIEAVCAHYRLMFYAKNRMKQVTEKTVAHFGRLDGVVAGAGGGSTGTVLETSAEDWRSQYEIKVGGVLNTVKPAVKELLKAEALRIVIINGITANIPDSHMAAVSASRAAVKQVAYMLAQTLAPEICVNTINLGAIDTDRQLARYKKSQSLSEL